MLTVFSAKHGHCVHQQTPASSYLKTSRRPICIYRHGHSLANAEEIIVSRLEEGKDPKWGLSATGHRQAEAAGEALLAQLGTFDPSTFLCFTSPFSRCLETAARAASHLDVHLHDPRFAQAEELRERFFGAHELTSTSNYELVWADDAKGTHIKPPGDGESVDEVAGRLRAFILEVESKNKGHNVLLVSHGDALSILAAVILGTDLAQHREHGMPNCGILRIPNGADLA